ncbi:MAG: hypothetical protein RBS57_07445 [Desulforhabdus sp.]|nr:hypothetical protein [Desulforhabdus sp.]
MKKLVFALALLAVVGMLTVDNSFARIDRSMAESCLEKFDRIDINNDGVITLSEYNMAFHEGQYAGAQGSPSGNEAWLIFSMKDYPRTGYLTPDKYCS